MERKRRIDFKKCYRSKRRNTRYLPRSRPDVTKFHGGQKWLSSCSTDLWDICSPPHFSILLRIQPIELDRWLDREGGASGFSPKLGMFQTWPTFTPADRISRYFHQLSRCLPRNLRSEDRGNCLEVALDPLLANHHEISRLQGSTVCKFSSS